MEQNELEYGIHRLPKEVREDFIALGEQFAKEDPSFEANMKELLARYDDSETGYFRQLLSQYYFMNQREEESKKLIEEMKQDPNAKYAAFVTEAEIELNLGHMESAKFILSHVPFEANEFTDTVRLKILIGALTDDLGWNQECYPYLSRFETEKLQYEYLELAFAMMKGALRQGSPQTLKPIQAHLCSYLKTHAPESIASVGMLQNEVANYSVEVNSHAWPRTSFLALADVIKESAWNHEDPQAFESMYVSVESYDANEDPNCSSSLIHLFLSIDGDDEYEINVTKWCGVSAWQKDPSTLDYIQNHYPHLYQSLADLIKPILENGETAKKEAFDALMATGDFPSKEELNIYLNSILTMSEQRMQNYRIVIDDIADSYDENYREDIEMVMDAYYSDQYDFAAQMLSQLLKQIDDRNNGYLTYVQAMTQAALRQGKAALKTAETLQKNLGETSMSQLAMAEALRATGNNRKAKKLYAKVTDPSFDPLHYVRNYTKVLRVTGGDDEVRDLIESTERKLDITANPLTKAFNFVSLIMFIEDDIVMDRSEETENDIELLKHVLYMHRPEEHAELELAHEITVLCTLITEDYPEHYELFLNLLKFFEEARVFSTHQSVLDSGYLAIEAAMLNEENNYYYSTLAQLNNSVVREERVLKIEGATKAELEAKQTEMSWMAAEILRNDPGILEEVKKRYPYMMSDADHVYREILEEPERIQADAEQWISGKSGRDPEWIRNLLRSEYQKRKPETKEADQ